MEEEIEVQSDVKESNVEVKKNYRVEKDGWIKPVNKKRETVKTIIYLILSAMIYALGFHYFVAPCKFAPGGVGGVVAIVQQIFRIAPVMGEIDWSGFLFIIINVPILIIASKSMSKDFVFKTAIEAVLITVTLFLTDNFIDKDYKFSIIGEKLISDMGTRIISAIVGGATCGISLAFSLKINSSTGGADVIGAILQKKNPHKSVAKMILTVNGVIMAVSVFVYQENLMPVYLSLIYLITSTMICDYFMSGAKSALKFEVITEHAEEISQEIIEELGHGVTITPAEGMFEHKQKSLLICIIKPRQINRFQMIIKKYPETFAYVGSVNEIIGKFNPGERK